jgi:hypothetical protein
MVFVYFWHLADIDIWPNVRIAPEAAIKKQTCGMSAFHPEAKTLHSRR